MNNLAVDTPTIYAASTLQEVQEIQALRYQVYIQEMGLDLPGADHAREVLVDPLDASGAHLYLRAGSQMAGAVRLNPNKVPNGLDGPLQTPALPRPFVYCSRLYVMKQWRGQGAVEQLAKACFAQFSEQHAAIAICHCYPRLVKLYANLGFETYGKPFVAAGLEYLGPQQPLRCILAPAQFTIAA